MREPMPANPEGSTQHTQPSPSRQKAAEGADPARQDSNAEVINSLRRAWRPGATSTVRFRDRDAVLITDPRHVMHVLVQRQYNYQKRPAHRAQRLIGRGLLSSVDELWEKQRKLLHSQFTATAVRRHDSQITARRLSTDSHQRTS
ncbi:cytochrome P450 [Streptomyces formicae]|uniref:Cytochrome P450 n=1 Tax=Streptomyces formicae TaxID=1616117 RepID=A0ABY3X030_9ACTN|nr:cytochrome P450 [Streptomyces formicae]UNM16101.1 cytochrome P450 [Streptomyces formicae]